MVARWEKTLRDQRLSNDVHHVLTPKEKTVTTAGTAEELVSTPTKVRSLTIEAKPGNTGQVYVGDYQVSSSDNDGMAPGATLDVPVNAEDGFIDLSLIYIDVDTAAEGVNLHYTVRTPV